MHTFARRHGKSLHQSKKIALVVEELTESFSGKGYNHRCQLLGLGAHLGSSIVQGHLSRVQAVNSLNWKELKVIAQALSIFSLTLQCHYVQAFTNNATAVAYINSQGGMKSRSFQGLTEETPLWESNMASLSTVNLKGTLNLVTNFLSRHQLKEA